MILSRFTSFTPSFIPFLPIINVCRIHYKKTTKIENIEWDDNTKSEIKLPKQSLPKQPKVNKEISQEQMDMYIMLGKAFANLISAGVKEWNTNPVLRSKIRETTYAFLDNFKRICIGPPSEEKEQYKRIDSYEDKQRLLLTSGFENGITYTKISKALGLKKFPAKPHEILGLTNEKHPTKEVKEKYHELAQKWHPDHASEKERDLHNLIFAEIKAAYNHMVGTK